MWWCGGGGNFPIVIPLQVRQLCFALHPDCGNFIVKMIVQNVSTDPVKPIKRRSVKINLVFFIHLSDYLFEFKKLWMCGKARPDLKFHSATFTQLKINLPCAMLDLSFEFKPECKHNIGLCCI